MFTSMIGSYPPQPNEIHLNDYRLMQLARSAFARVGLLSLSNNLLRDKFRFGLPMHASQ